MAKQVCDCLSKNLFFLFKPFASGETLHIMDQVLLTKKESRKQDGFCRKYWHCITRMTSTMLMKAHLCIDTLRKGAWSPNFTRQPMPKKHYSASQ